MLTPDQIAVWRDGERAADRGQMPDGTFVIPKEFCEDGLSVRIGGPIEISAYAAIQFMKEHRNVEVGYADDGTDYKLDCRADAEGRARFDADAAASYRDTMYGSNSK